MSLLLLTVRISIKICASMFCASFRSTRSLSIRHSGRSSVQRPNPSRRSCCIDLPSYPADRCRTNAREFSIQSPDLILASLCISLLMSPSLRSEIAKFCEMKGRGDVEMYAGKFRHHGMVPPSGATPDWLPELALLPQATVVRSDGNFVVRNTSLPTSLTLIDALAFFLSAHCATRQCKASHGLAGLGHHPSVRVARRQRVPGWRSQSDSLHAGKFRTIVEHQLPHVYCV